jgi:hypothetical protein
MRASFPNNFGDGEWEIRIEDKANSVNRNDYDFLGTVEGSKINVYEYDCSSTRDLTDPNHILCTLSGRYAVYASRGGWNGDMLLEKWN